jgi:tetratricopeptide (TPR) repeat protein
VRLLEANGESWWAATASWILGMNCSMLGEFDNALAAQAYTDAVGRALRDDHLLACAAWASGFALAHSGDLTGAIAACRRAIETSHDHFNTSRAIAVLGLAHARNGELREAIAALERAVAMASGSSLRTLQGMFLGWLSEAYRLNGDLVRAREAALEGIEMGTAVAFPFGLAAARRALGEMELASGEIAKGIEDLSAARDTYTSIDARYEAERTGARMAEAAASA